MSSPTPNIDHISGAPQLVDVPQYNKRKPADGAHVFGLALLTLGYRGLSRALRDAATMLTVSHDQQMASPRHDTGASVDQLVPSKHYGDGDGDGDGERTNSDTDDRVELKERDAYDKLGYSYPTWRKWLILSVMFYIQISINLNASMYASAVTGIHKRFGISEQAARVPQLTFLVAYAFGCELWAPWSEELGRWPTQQLSLLLVNIWQIPCALAPNFATYVVCRALGGLSTAGGSVTLGVLADMWEPDDQEYAIAYLVLSSVGGSVVGAIVGGFVETYLPLSWIFWIQLIAGGAAQIIHAVIVPETRATLLLDKEAKRRRKAGEKNIYGPIEIKGGFGLSFKEVITVWVRPFYMLFTEPIVAWLSALSGFSDALIFTFLQGFQPIYKQYGFNTVQISLAFIP